MHTFCLYELPTCQAFAIRQQMCCLTVIPCPGNSKFTRRWFSSFKTPTEVYLLVNRQASHCLRFMGMTDTERLWAPIPWRMNSSVCFFHFCHGYGGHCRLHKQSFLPRSVWISPGPLDRLQHTDMFTRCHKHSCKFDCSIYAWVCKWNLRMVRKCAGPYDLVRSMSSWV